MKNMQRTIEVAVVCLGSVLAAGCVVDQYGRVIFFPNTPVVVSPVPAENYQVQNLRQRAAQGSAMAQFTLGSCYANGRGVVRNYVEAVKWYRLSAEQGYAPAQNRLGNCYYTGRGVARDYSEAVFWYRLSAEQGYAPAQNRLGVCYYNGRGIAPDYAEAVAWYRKAAAQGDLAAKNNLLACESKGLAVGTSGPNGQAAHTPPAEPNDASAGNSFTVDEIKELSSAGVKADTLIDQIKTTNSKFSAQDIAVAQQANVDPSVIECMKENLR